MDGWSNQPPMDETKRSLTRVSVSKILKANLLLFSLGLEIEFSGLYVYGWRRGGQLQIQMTMAKFDRRVSGNCCCSGGDDLEAAAEFAKQSRRRWRGDKGLIPSRWQKWQQRHLQLGEVVVEDEQAFAFLPVHSSTLAEHWAIVKHSGKQRR